MYIYSLFLTSMFLRIVFLSIISKCTGRSSVDIPFVIFIVYKCSYIVSNYLYIIKTCYFLYFMCVCVCVCDYFLYLYLFSILLSILIFFLFRLNCLFIFECVFLRIHFFFIIIKFFCEAFL